jgi:fatty-acyl-CoA synthase
MVMANYSEFVTVKFAISRTGAIAVPANYLYKQDELAYVLADSGCRVLVTMTGFDGLDYQAMLDGIAPGWDSATFADRTTGATTAFPRCGTSCFLTWTGGPAPGCTRLRLCPRWDPNEPPPSTSSGRTRTRPLTSCTPVEPLEPPRVW